ncbi:MAG: 50S ribosomal protein L25 [Clostridiaceae bacterium]|nr:50S ribosomal protein L25 [Clostridiaceae bacterium]
MEEIILKAMTRSESPKKARRAGFIPGVLNANDTTSTSVQFEAIELNRIITRHGSNAKLWVDFEDAKKFGFIKELQKNPVDGKVIHASIQLVSTEQDVKMILPISYHGRDDLESHLLQIQVYKDEVAVIGKPMLMPDVVTVDIAKKEQGSTVTAIDFHLPAEIKILDPEQEIYAVIKAVKEKPAEETEEVQSEE